MGWKRLRFDPLHGHHTLNGVLPFLLNKALPSNQSCLNDQSTESGNISPESFNKLSWKRLPGTYTNGCVFANGQWTSYCNMEGSKGNFQVKVADSNAAKACRDLGAGARLPTVSELESLIRSYEHTTVEGFGPRLTSNGFAAMETVFGDIRKTSFWSSTIDLWAYPGYSHVHVLSGFTGSVVSTHRGQSGSVLCVIGQ